MPNTASAVKEALMQGSKESDYLLFVEAKKEENPLGDTVAIQAEHYAIKPQNWYGLWFNNQIHLVFLANGKRFTSKICLFPIANMKKFLQCTRQSKCLK